MHPETEKKRNTQKFQTEKKFLAASDLGSWYKQEQQWPEILESEESQSTPSTSRRKIETSRLGCNFSSANISDSDASVQWSEDSNGNIALDPESFYEQL